MTQEDKRYFQGKLCQKHDKELLLKDLCARLPYGVKLETLEGAQELDIRWLAINMCNVTSSYLPYLFPMSNITKEQRNDISKLLIDIQNEYPPYGKLNTNACDNLFICVTKQANIFIDYCLTHHLDINDLISKRLALDATGLNIY